MDWESNRDRLEQLQELLQRCSDIVRNSWNLQAVPDWAINEEFTSDSLVEMVEMGGLPPQVMEYVLLQCQTEALKLIGMMLTDLDNRKDESGS